MPLAVALPSNAPHLRIGYLPLTDAAPLIAADALGLFAKYGLRVALLPNGAWAALRDRLLYGALDASHLLYPMPIAAAVGLGQKPRALVAACGLGRNGNTLTLSHTLSDALSLTVPPVAIEAFTKLARHRARCGQKLRLAIVHVYSTHGYLLRQWLASGGLDPDEDVVLEVVPPPLVTHELAAGSIDGFCAGEPWGSHAVLAGAGRIAFGTGAIWPDHSEKLLVFSSDLVTREPDLAIAATAAVIEAAQWLDEPSNHPQAIAMLQKSFPDLDTRALAAAFAGTVLLPEGGTYTLPHPLRFVAATRPDPAQASAWLKQMRRWGHVPDTASDATALSPFDNDLWAQAAARLTSDFPEFHSSSLPEA
jgi:ABC-type nitrate/sulfonate/bicarbonate transport system substrate-binding protein